jgi:hypothetical protein
MRMFSFMLKILILTENPDGPRFAFKIINVAYFSLFRLHLLIFNASPSYKWIPTWICDYSGLYIQIQ